MVKLHKDSFYEILQYINLTKLKKVIIYSLNKRGNFMEKNGFMDIYPFATENVNGYLERMDMKDKSILTVGSSLDQTFNAINLGVKKITVFDISPNNFEFFKIKKDIILSTDRKDLYKILTNEKELKKHLNITTQFSISKDILTEKQVYSTNNYLANDEEYQLLRSKLVEANVEFVTGDIFKMDEVLNDEKYDRIIFSNILQYIEYFFKDKDSFEVLKCCFKVWEKHLNEEGILQLLYLYSYSYDDIYRNHPIATYNLINVINALKGYKLDIEWIKGVAENKHDAIVTYQKRR